jgi:hypothetical protein
MKNRRVLSAMLPLIVLLASLFGPVQAQGPDPQTDELQFPSTVPTGPQTGAGVAALASAFSGGPAYDSGWVALNQDEAKTLTYNLGGNTDNYVVDMQYQVSGGDGVNQRYYGGADFGANTTVGHPDDRVGAYWRSLTTTSITVYRRPEDTYAPEVRIRIWVDASPNYNSGWVALNQDQASTLTHSLGGSADDYVVDMQYRSAADGVNQRYYGGADFGVNPAPGHNANDRVGAYWRSLSSTTITVYRRPDDTYAPEVRVRIWIRPTPTYDSGWLAMSQDQSRTLTHGIGGSTDDYVVDMQFKSAANGVNQRHYGGADFGTLPPAGMNPEDRVGAYWRTLTSASITIYRRPQDVYAEQIRIRIWRFWRPSVPSYDSGWVAFNQDQATTLTYNVGGNADNYMVDMQYRASGTDGINQRYYGGADFGAKITLGNPDDRVGAYWRTLTSNSITVYRRPEDTFAPNIRIRIWNMPKPDYDSGWVSFSQDQAQTLTHNLGGSYLDYLVDVQYKAADVNGVNQRHYGGADWGAKNTTNNARMGAYWRSLSNNSITVYRRPEDIYASQIRVRLWRMASPDYASGWAAMTQDVAKDLSHNLGGLAENYLVNMLFWDTSVDNLVNQRHYGGADFGASPPAGYNPDDRVGAYWRTLTSSSITVYRRPEDGFADYAYIRIWVTPYRVYLPVVMRN